MVHDDDRVLESHRFGSNMPRTVSSATSIRTPMSSDLQTDHEHPFDQELRSFRHVFPPMRRASSAGRALQLTREEADTLSDLATSLRVDVIAAYETHVNVNKRQANSSEWKSVKKRDHLVVVKQRRKGWSEAMGGAAVAPTMMAFGVIAGQLDDLLYGLSSETTMEMKLQASYSSGTLHDAAVLTALETATTTEPFRFLGVKWVLQSFGSGSSSSSAKTLMKRRDLMYLESLGVAILSNGERIGYRIIHSVNFKSMAHLSENAVRAKVSMSQVYRQRSDGKTLDVFMRGYYDPSGGRVSQLLATTLSADLMLHLPGDALECANLKKLAWCAKQSGRRRRKLTAIMRQQHSGVDSDEVRAAMQELQDAESGLASSTCKICHRDCGKMLRRSGCACMVCSQLVCTRCSVVKKLSFAMGPSLSSDVLGLQHHHPVGSQDEGGADIRQKALSFCLHCIVASNRERAIDMAVSDLEERGVGPSQPAEDGNTPVPRQPMSSTHNRNTPGSTASRSRQSTVWQERPSQATPQSTRRRATTTSSKRMSTVLSYNGLAPSDALNQPANRPTKAFSVVTSELGSKS